MYKMQVIVVTKQGQPRLWFGANSKEKVFSWTHKFVKYPPKRIHFTDKMYLGDFLDCLCM